LTIVKILFTQCTEKKLQDAPTYVALVSLIAGLRRAVRLQWLFHCDHDHGIIFKTTLLFVCYFLFLQINSCAFGET
ncbi:hypothetical protein T05_15434, partial [Trichinella murrelli]